MPMKKTLKKTAKLSLAVQYATRADELPRWRLRRWVQRALMMATPVESLELTLRLVGKKEGRELNLAYRDKDYATNVLTFAYDQVSGLASEGVTKSAVNVVADVVICTSVLREEARVQRKGYLDHAAHLVVHGTLHALGYDHEAAAQAKEMEVLETQILRALGVPDPY
jgi:probable rRNA maturation factor